MEAWEEVGGVSKPNAKAVDGSRATDGVGTREFTDTCEEEKEEEKEDGKQKYHVSSEK